LASALDIDIQYAKDLTNSYFSTFRGVYEFLNEMAANVINTHKAISVLDGRTRDLSHLDWDDKRMVSHAQNIAKNMPFQGGNASMIKLAMAYLAEKIERYGRDDLRLVACVHDEFVVEGDKDKLEEGKKLVLDTMMEAGHHYVKSVPMKVGVDIGEHWVK